MKKTSEDSFLKKTFFPKFKLLNSGCGLSAGAAYLRVFTVYSPSMGLKDTHSVTKTIFFLFSYSCEILGKQNSRGFIHISGSLVICLVLTAGKS